MLGIFRKLVSAALAVSLVSVVSVAASAETTYDYNAAASHSWNVRVVGGGAPSSADRAERFYIYYSILGAKGNCETLTSGDTTFGVKLSCIDDLHTINYYPMGEDDFGEYMVWNGTGTKTWTYAETDGNNVRYWIRAYGSNTNSTGLVSRV